MSNVGLWAEWYDGAASRPYLIDDDDLTYREGAKLLEGMAVADWGCGLGWMRNFIPAHLYTGIDGTASDFADVVADLAEYVCPTEGLFMRHVLEHDERWPAILDNALRSVQKRMVLVLYTPLVEQTQIIGTEPTLGVVEQSFSEADILARMGDHLAVDVHPVGIETVFVIDR